MGHHVKTWMKKTGPYGGKDGGQPGTSYLGCKPHRVSSVLQYLTPWFYPNATCKIIDQTPWPGLNPKHRVFTPMVGYTAPTLRCTP